MTAIEETKDLNKMSLDEVLGSLMTHDITLKGNEEINESKMKKEIVFKTSSSHTNEATPDDEESDE